MTPEQIAAVRADAASVATLRESPGGRWLLRAHPALDAVPALLDEIAFLTERLDRANADYEACVQSHQKMNAQYERATDVLERIAYHGLSELEARGAARFFLKEQ